MSWEPNQICRTHFYQIYSRILYTVFTSTYFMHCSLCHKVTNSVSLHTLSEWTVMDFSRHGEVHSDQYLKRISGFHLWTSFSKELRKQIREPGFFARLLPVQTGRKPPSENASNSVSPLQMAKSTHQLLPDLAFLINGISSLSLS